jgi:hypothetical protein
MLIIFGTIVVAFLFLRYGNPQWNRWIYIYQANVWPKWSEGHIPCPKDYTGTLTHWYSNGKKAYEGNVCTGKLVGIQRSWFRNGQRRQEIMLASNGAPDGLSKAWDETGVVEYTTAWKNGRAVEARAVSNGVAIYKDKGEDLMEKWDREFYPDLNRDVVATNLMKKN